MVKKFIFSVSVFLSVFISFSQDWKGKLEQARKSYQAENFSESYQHYLEAKNSLLNQSIFQMKLVKPPINQVILRSQ